MFRNIIIIVFIGLITLIAVSYFIFQQATSDIPAEYQMAGQNKEIININGKKLIVEIADDPEEQIQGLSYRKSLGSESGMLFVFEQPLIPAFWMKDMNFALDILWINADGMLVMISKNISPNTYPQTFQPSSPVKYVLEVNAGWSDKNKIKVGDKMSFK